MQALTNNSSIRISSTEQMLAIHSNDLMTKASLEQISHFITKSLFHDEVSSIRDTLSTKATNVSVTTLNTSVQVCYYTVKIDNYEYPNSIVI